MIDVIKGKRKHFMLSHYIIHVSCCQPVQRGRVDNQLAVSCRRYGSENRSTKESPIHFERWLARMLRWSRYLAKREVRSCRDVLHDILTRRKVIDPHNNFPVPSYTESTHTPRSHGQQHHRRSIGSSQKQLTQTTSVNECVVPAGSVSFVVETAFVSVVKRDVISSVGMDSEEGG
jgi:hypothetical protein